MNILVIEDNVLLGKSIKQGLEEAGFAVELALDGKAGLALAKSYSCDLIILDWMLPNLSGIDLLQDIRRNGKETPTIMMTAKGALEDRIKGFEQGADHQS